MGVCVLLAVWVLGRGLWTHATLIATDWPQEYREAAMVLCTDLMLRGQNPFDLVNQPVYTNLYGVTYHLVVYPLAKLGGNGLLVHRIVSAVCVLATCALVWLAVRREQTGGASLGLAFVASVLLYADLALRNLAINIWARPDALGMLLFLASVLVPMWWRFSRGSLVAAGALGILGFLTKAYFGVGIPIVASYLFLFVSKRRGLIFGSSALAILAVTVWVVTLAAECYVRDVLIIQSNLIQDSFAHLWGQIVNYVRETPGRIVLLFIFTGIWIASIRLASKPTVNFRDLPKPLLSKGPDIVTYSLIIILIILVAWMGRHTGNYLTYFYQLLSPFLLVVVFRELARPENRKRAWLLLAVVLDLAIMLRGWPSTDTQPQIWRQWDTVIASSQHPYVSPPLALIAHRQGKPVYDAGFSEYFLSAPQNNGSPFDIAVLERIADHYAKIGEQVDRGRFDLIVQPYFHDVPMFSFVNEDRLNERYQVRQVMDIPMPLQRGWKAVIWERRSTN